MSLSTSLSFPLPSPPPPPCPLPFPTPTAYTIEQDYPWLKKFEKILSSKNKYYTGSIIRLLFLHQSSAQRGGAYYWLDNTPLFAP